MNIKRKRRKRMEQFKIDRINELARKAKQGPLTEAEAAERHALRQEYLDAVRKNLKAQLDQIEIIDTKNS